jgi:hypothetical protein
MNAAAINEALALGAITGMRSMAGPAILGRRYGGMLKPVTALFAAGEMAADKTTVIGDRTDAIPLAGRAVMGALVGGIIAREHHGNIVLGAAVGAAAAFIGAHLAFRLRKQLPQGAMGGLIEDGVVMGLSALYSSRARHA